MTMIKIREMIVIINNTNIDKIILVA